jgi:hypothetical protein
MIRIEIKGRISHETLFEVPNNLLISGCREPEGKSCCRSVRLLIDFDRRDLLWSFVLIYEIRQLKKPPGVPVPDILLDEWILSSQLISLCAGHI